MERGLRANPTWLFFVVSFLFLRGQGRHPPVATGNAPKTKTPFPISPEICRRVTCPRSPSRNTPRGAGGNRHLPQPGCLFAARNWVGFFLVEMVNLYYCPRRRRVPLGDPARASRYAVPETVRMWLLMAGGSNAAKTGSGGGKNVGYPMGMGCIMPPGRELWLYYI